MLTNKLKINLFGEGIRVKQILLNPSQLEKIKATAYKLNTSIELALIDPYFYHELNDKQITTFEDYEGLLIEGLLNTPKNLIEIWFKGKKLIKFKFQDLFNENLLFPLYNTKLTESRISNFKGFLIQEIEIGLIASFEYKLDLFDISKLEFNLEKNEGNFVLNKIFYENTPLLLKKKDTLRNRILISEIS